MPDTYPIPFGFRLHADPNNPNSEEDQARIAIRACDWWRAAGLDEAWPITTDDAVTMLRDCGMFDIDREGLLDLVERRLLKPPAVDDDGGFEWGAYDLLLAVAELEAREQWRPAPVWHDIKKSDSRVRLEVAREAGILAQAVVGPNGERHDVRSLIVAMTKCDNAEGRAKLQSLLIGTLEVEHELIV